MGFSSPRYPDAPAGMPAAVKQLLEQWHSAVVGASPSERRATLTSLLSPTVTFHTPLYLKKRTGAPIVAILLEAASINLEHLTYVRELFSADWSCWILHFEARVDGDKLIRGVDIIQWDLQSGKIVEMEVMTRPLNVTQRFGEKQAELIKSILEQHGLTAKL